MSENRDEIILKPDQLRSVTACKKAICNIATKTNRDPLEIWQSNEDKLSKQTVTPTLTPNELCLRRVIRLYACVAIAIIAVNEIKATGLSKNTLLGTSVTLLYTLTIVATTKIAFIPYLLKTFTATASIGFATITAILGFYSTAPDSTKTILGYLVGIYVFYLPPCILPCGALWWIWASRNKEHNSKKDQLTILHATLPLLIRASQHNEDSESDTTKHLIATNATSKAPISLILTASTLITAGLLLRNRISNQ